MHTCIIESAATRDFFFFFQYSFVDKTAHTRAHTHAHIHTHTYTCIHMDIHTHAHTSSLIITFCLYLTHPRLLRSLFLVFCLRFLFFFFFYKLGFQRTDTITCLFFFLINGHGYKRHIIRIHSYTHVQVRLLLFFFPLIFFSCCNYYPVELYAIATVRFYSICVFFFFFLIFLTF